MTSFPKKLTLREFYLRRLHEISIPLMKIGLHYKEFVIQSLITSAPLTEILGMNHIYIGKAPVCFLIDILE